MSYSCWASHQAASAAQPWCTVMENLCFHRELEEGRSHFWTFGPSSLREKGSAETDPGTRALQTGEQMPRGNRRSPPPPISEPLQHITAWAAVMSEGKGAPLGVKFSINVKQPQAVSESPNCHLEKTSYSAACSEVLQLRRREKKLPVLKWLGSWWDSVEWGMLGWDRKVWEQKDMRGSYSRKRWT